MGSSVDVILMPSIRDANHDFVFPQVSWCFFFFFLNLLLILNFAIKIYLLFWLFQQPAFEIHPADFSHQVQKMLYELHLVWIKNCIGTTDRKIFYSTDN